MSARQLVLGSVFLIACYLALFGDRETYSESETVEVVDRGPRRTHDELVKRTAATADKSGAPADQRIPQLATRPALRPVFEPPDGHEGAFGVRSWDPPPPPPPKPTGGLQAPQAPPLPYAVLGKQHKAGAWEVFLAVGEDVRVARLDAVLDGQYRVMSIQPPHMTLLYLPLKQAQTLDIGAAK